MDGLGTSMDCFSLLVGMRPEQGVSFSAGPQRKQGISAPLCFQTRRGQCPRVLSHHEGFRQWRAGKCLTTGSHPSPHSDL